MGVFMHRQVSMAKLQSGEEKCGREFLLIFFKGNFFMQIQLHKIDQIHKYDHSYLLLFGVYKLSFFFFFCLLPSLLLSVSYPFFQPSLFSLLSFSATRLSPLTFGFPLPIFFSLNFLFPFPWLSPSPFFSLSLLLTPFFLTSSLLEPDDIDPFEFSSCSYNK